MAHQAHPHRFGPDVWATVASTGEYVEVQLWSQIANAYRVRSSGSGIQFYQDSELTEITPHPEEDFGRNWRRCRATTCGAPLTDKLEICETCKTPTCTCGRCACSPAIARRAKTKKAATAKKAAKKAQPTPEVEKPDAEVGEQE